MQNFLKGTVVLTIGMAVVKLVGALFKVPLKSVIAEYGMGLFNVAYHFYGPVHSLATAGLPIAIARLVSARQSEGGYREIRKIKAVSTPIFFLLGALGTAVMLFGAPYYCREVIQNEGAILPMLVLAPAVLLGCLGSIYRGYFEGLKNMYPTAVSEIIEALSKLIVGLSGAAYVSHRLNRAYLRTGQIWGRPMASPDEAALTTLSFAAAAAILGVTVGSLISFLFLYWRYHSRGDGITPAMLSGAPAPGSGRSIGHAIVKTAVPVAIGSLAVNLTGLIDTTFLQQRLTNLLQKAPETLITQYQNLIPDMYLRQPDTIPNFLFGCYALALTVYMLVPTVTQAISTSALPNITALWIEGKRDGLQRGVETVLRVTALVSLPMGIGISAISGEIAVVLYGEEPATAIVGRLLVGLGFSAALAALSTPISSMLQAVGRADIPVKLLLAAMGIKVGLNYLLCGIPALNVYGVTAGTFCCYLFMVLSQLICLRRVTGLRIPVHRLFLKPMLSALLCGISAYVMSNCGWFSLTERKEALAAVLCSMGIAALVYVISLWALGAVTREDIQFLPKGQKILKMLENPKGM